MKRLFIIVLSILIFLPSFGSLFVYASFKINQDEIAKTICVQRKQVFNSCNGRCELKKSIKRYTDNERKMQDKLKDKVELVYVQNTIDVDFEVIPVSIPKKNIPVLFEKKPVSVSHSTFHPPLC